MVKFRQTIISRWKRIALLLWRGHILRRHKCRVFFLWYDARKRYDVIERCFDKWRAFAIMDRCSSEIQRVARGFIGRRRRDLTKAVVQRSVIIQAVSRKAYHRKKYSQLRERRHWGAITIQVFRKIKLRLICKYIAEAFSWCSWKEQGSIDGVEPFRYGISPIAKGERSFRVDATRKCYGLHTAFYALASKKEKDTRKDGI